jgi:hypothetical protein
MRTFLLAAAAALTLVAPAIAGDLPNFSDKDVYTCDQAEIERELGSLVSNNVFRVSLLYVKDIKETGRTGDELRCHLTAVTTNSTVPGVFRYLNRDGHSLIGWLPYVKK